MADSKSIIMELDTGKAITSVKEMKKYIEDLKGALLGLTEGTDEYNKEAKKLRDAQQKLNDVMYEAKKNSEGVEGSYDALVYKMRELKKQWRATADEAERANLGKQILSLNDSLKQLDASVGDYKRSVGDYRNAWSEVFNSALGPLGKVGGKLGDLARQVKSLQPLIKQVNTTAVSGLKGITRAIASTGIGLLVLAVGELAANWESVTNWIKNAVIAQDDYNRVLKETETRLNALILKNAEYSKDWDAVEKQRKILFEGYTEVTFAQERLNKALDAQEKAIEANEDATKEWKDAWDEVNEAEKEIKAATTDGELFQANQRYTKAQQNAIQATVNYGLAQKNLQVINEGVAVSTQNLANAKKTEENATKSNTNAHKEAKSTLDSEKQSLEDLYRRIVQYESLLKEGDFREAFILQEDDYARDKKLLDTALENKKISQEDYENWTLRMESMYAEKRFELRKEQSKYTVNYLKNSYENQAKAITEGLQQSLKQMELSSQINKLIFKDDEKGFRDKIYDGFNNIFGTQSTILEVYDKKTKEINKTFEKSKEATKERINLYGEEADAIKKYIEQIIQSQIEDDFDRLGIKPTINELLTYVDEGFNNLVEEYKTLGVDEYGIADYLDALSEKGNAEMELSNLVTQNDIDNLEIQNEKEEELQKARDARWQLMGTAISATSNIMKQFASMQEQQIKDDVANGKISEREANKKFKRVKALQKAAAVMETAQAAMGAYSSLASIPYVGPALGIAAAAAAVAQGLMQIKQIDKTTLSSSSSSNLSTSTPDMNSVTNTYEPTYVTNMQSNTELSELANVVGSIQPVVKVTDINDAQNTVKVRDEENSF